MRNARTYLNPGRHRQLGLSLVELMVAMTLSLLGLSVFLCAGQLKAHRHFDR